MTLTQAQLQEVIRYDPLTGQFFWRTCRWRRPQNAAPIEREIVPKPDHGYARVRIEGVLYYMHRVAWLYMTGDWPSDEIDHINGNRSDNTFSNLREATSEQNKHNVGLCATNTSGFKGVSWDKRDRRWYPYIWVNNKKRHLGSFSSAEEAHKAYTTAAQRLRGEFARVA